MLCVALLQGPCRAAYIPPSWSLTGSKGAPRGRRSKTESEPRKGAPRGRANLRLNLSREKGRGGVELASLRSCWLLVSAPRGGRGASVAGPGGPARAPVAGPGGPAGRALAELRRACGWPPSWPCVAPIIGPHLYYPCILRTPPLDLMDRSQFVGRGLRVVPAVVPVSNLRL